MAINYKYVVEFGGRVLFLARESESGTYIVFLALDEYLEAQTRGSLRKGYGS